MMTLYDLLLLHGMVDDDTYIILVDPEDIPLAGGKWFQDQILNYSECEVKSFDINFITNRAQIYVYSDFIL